MKIDQKLGIAAIGFGLGAAIRHASDIEEALASLPGDDLRQRAVELSRTTTMSFVEAAAFVRTYGLMRLPGEAPLAAEG